VLFHEVYLMIRSGDGGETVANETVHIILMGDYSGRVIDPHAPRNDHRFDGHGIQLLEIIRQAFSLRS
jgi:hypothetical protein